MRKIIIPAITIIASFTAGYLCSDRYRFIRIPAAVSHRSDTIVTTEYLRDTIIVTLPRSADIRPVVGHYIPLVIEKKDTVYLPVERRVYSDSTFYAEVSGYHPSLDTLAIFPTARVETRSIKTRSVSARPASVSRWGLGITAGATVTPRGLSPGLAIGLTYRLMPL